VNVFTKGSFNRDVDSLSDVALLMALKEKVTQIEGIVLWGLRRVLYCVYFKFSLRKHPQTEKLSGYYRLVESYRNADNKVFHRTILNVGFMEDVTTDQLTKIQKQLTERYERKQTLFEQEQDDPIVKKYVEGLWQRIVASKKLDLVSVDDGKGFEKSSLESTMGSGWANIKSRVEYLKGKLDVTTQPGEGTSVHIELPV